MKLYGSFTSPYVRHCRIVLLQNNLDFTFIETDYDMSAERSPTAKVPFLIDGDVQLTDSSSILKYLREKTGKRFLAELEDFDTYTLVNTIMDSAINLFLLAKDGIGPQQSPYLERQQRRVESGLIELDRRISQRPRLTCDSTLRCACFIDWAVFRNLIGLEGHKQLADLMLTAGEDEDFTATSPTIAQS